MVFAKEFLKLKLAKFIYFIFIVSFTSIFSSCKDLQRISAQINFYLDNPKSKDGIFWSNLHTALEGYQSLKNQVENFDTSETDKKIFDFYNDFFPKPNLSTPEKIRISSAASKLIQKIKPLSRHINSPQTLILLRSLGLNDRVVIDIDHVKERHLYDGTDSTIKSPVGVSGGMREFEKFRRKIKGIKTIFPKDITERDIYKIIEKIDLNNLSSDYELLESDSPKFLVGYKPRNIFIEFIKDGSIVKTAYPVLHYEDISDKERDYILELNWNLIDVVDKGAYILPLSKDGILDYFSKNKVNPIYAKGNFVVVNVTPIIVTKNPELRGKVPPVYVKIDKTEISSRKLVGPSPAKRKINSNQSPAKLVAATSASSLKPKKLF